MPRTIWVTGASGFTGKHLISALRRQSSDCQIIAIRNGDDPVDGADETVSLNINDCSAIHKVAKRSPPTGVYHLAGLIPPADEISMFQTNVMGTYALINGLHKARCTGIRLLTVGSAAEYFSNDTGYYRESSPVGGFSPYGRAKSAQTMIALKAGEAMEIDIVVARPFNIIGPGLSSKLVLGEICQQLATGKKKLTLGNTSTERDFIDVRDVVDAYIALFERGKTQNVYNVCTGESTSIMDLVKTAGDAYGVRPEVVKEASKIKNQDSDRAYGSPEKIYADTQWRAAISIAQSVEDMKDSFK